MTDFLEHHVASANTIVFAFASGSMQQFEWGGTLDRLGVSYVLVRDSKQHWYCNGIEGWGDLRASVRRVNRIAEPYQLTLALGLSRGAYGALLYGAYALLDGVIAISPITGKDKDVHDDIPAQHHHRVAHQEGDPWFPDLKPIYQTRPPVWVRAFVSDGRGTDLDYIMALRIGAEVVSIPGHSHDGLATYMRDAGIIRRLICGGL